ncbi:MAG: ABC transporter ATP-binding protein [Chloroflexi bacterium]|nr:ABC transporter ATP-binding protein [Chloroflexota bacterium]
MIEVEHLTKYYGPSPAVRDVSFNVEQGEILGFLGPNGAGKTTTMRMITGYLPATSGTVRVAGYDVAEKSLEARQHLGYLPETVPLYTELTTREYLDFRGRITGLNNSKERRARINEVMDELNLESVAGRLIGNLSRGYRQRVGLAQAMLHNPDALILDEPTVGLDPVQITEVRALIKELGRNHTIILSTHLLPEVSMVCNRVVIINRGRLVAVDTPIHMAAGASQQQKVQLEVGGAPAQIVAALQSVQGVAKVTTMPQQGSNQVAYGSTDSTEVTMPVSEVALPEGVNLFQVEGKEGADIRAQVASVVVGGGYQLLELKSITPTLEDIFIQVITQEEENEEASAGQIASGMAGDSAGGDEYLDGSEYDDGYKAAPQVRTRVTARKRVRR